MIYLPELFILNYRFIPQEVKKHILEDERAKASSKDRKGSKDLEKRIRKVNHIVNALNIKLHKALRRDDTTFVSRTTLESTRYRPQNIVVLRAVLVNPLTDKPILEEVVDTQNRIGIEIWQEFRTAYQRILKEPVEGKGRKAQG